MQRDAHDDPLARRLRLHQRDAFADDAVGVDGGEGELELARLDLAQIEQIVGEARHVAAGGVDVLEIVLVALVADRPETLLHHHFGEAQDGVQGRADFMADLGEKVGLGGARGLGGVARSGEPPLGLALAGEIAHERAKVRGLARADPRQRQRQRNRTAAAIAPDRLQRARGRFGFADAA